MSEKYGPDGATGSTSQNLEASVSTATIPTPEKREIRDSVFRNPDSRHHERIADYYRCQHELVAADILFFCRSVKENWPRPVLTGAFYGYFFSLFNRQAAGGHLELQQVLASPWIDYLSGPQVYYPDDGYDPGEPYRSRSLVRSVTLHGKLWLDEYDQQPRRTFPMLNGKDNTEKYRQNVQENVAAIERNVLSALTKGAGLWFYDFGPSGMNLHRDNEHDIQSGTIGYWDHPDYLRCIKKLKILSDSMLHQPWKTDADVLLVFDTEVFYYLKSTRQDSCPISSQVVDWLPLALSYAGVAWDAVHLDDLLLLDPTPYKAVIFANTWLLHKKDLDTIQRRWERDGRHLFWVYAPGQLGDSDPSQVTGFQLVASQCDTAAVFAGVDHLPRQSAWGRLNPLWAVNATADTVIARYEHDGSPAVAKQRKASHTAWFLGIPPIDAHWWRYLLADSGANFYTDNGVVYIGGGLLVFHTKTGGEQKIMLKNRKEILVKMPIGAGTIILDAVTGSVLKW